METFYITKDGFWEWFNRENDTANNKRMKTELKSGNKSENGPPRSIAETEAATRADSRYIILYGRHKPGKKSKTWEGDGYLTLVGQMAHLCDLRGRMLEEPTILDDIDYKLVEDLGELLIGNTEVQVIEVDKKK